MFFLGRIGTAAASIIQHYLGTKENDSIAEARSSFRSRGKFF